MRLLKKITASVLSLCMAVSSAAVVTENIADNVSAASGNCVVEYLDRSVTAVSTGSGMLVSWRFLANDAENAEFKLYRDNTLIYTSSAGEATCFLDKSGSAKSKYRVDTLNGGKVISSSECSMISGNNYFDIPLTPPTASDCTYSPNDCSVGDVDGDGVYELFLKWDPSNSKDNSQKGKTGKVYIDCYKLSGKRLWRIDLGYNIRAGAHYTQFYVADFDLDGKAEMTCKTADGTVDGTGKTIGDGSKNYRNSSGFIITGPEYYTLFDGATGAALDTIDYEPGRGNTKAWGKSSDSTNRVDRFWGTVAYLDGVHPSVVTGRGYYGRMTATAYTVKNKKLQKLWMFDTGTSSSAPGYGDGNHNSMAADVDGDGKQEIITGSTCIDDNGKLLWCLNKGHGDAMHVGDLDPSNPGIEAWICHEDKPYGVSLVDCDTGKIIFHNNGSGDTGRCCGDNVWAGNPGAELWGNKESDGSMPVKNVKGETLSCRRPAINFLSYWDGDLEREILDGYTDTPATITKMNDKGTLDTLLTTDGYYTCNTTKGTPCLSADIFGDWREELIVRAADSKSVRIYTTTYTTDYRITTLMHDVHYRTQVSAQNTAYNQPPHLSYYLGSEKGVPARESVKVLAQGEVVTPEPVITPESFDNGSAYRIKNVNSGLYMQVDGAKAANNTNVQQWGTSESTIHDIWKLIDAGDGYYYLVSAVGDGGTYVLDVAGKKTANGTNIDIYQLNNGDNQKFMITKNSDGSYKLRPKITGDKSAVEIKDAGKGSGDNVQIWEVNGANCQDWIFEKVSDPGCKMDTSVIYEFENVNSKMVMDIASGKMEADTNVQQWSTGHYKSQQWTLQAFAGGGNYYYIRSYSNPQYVLRAGSGSNGGNINIAEYSTKDSAMLFKFSKNPDGSYYIMTRASKDACLVEIANASVSSGANVQQWAPTNNNCQKWNAETFTTPTVTTSATTTTTTVTTTTNVTTGSTTTSTDVGDVVGDVNDDGEFSIADIILIKKWLVAVPDTKLENWKAADLNNDGMLNVFDLCLMKRELVKAL